LDACNLALKALVRPEEIDAHMAHLDEIAQNRDTVKTAEQGSQAWLDSRGGKITASAAGAAAGLGYTGPNETPLDGTVRQCKKMLYGGFAGSPATQYGHKHEVDFPF